MIPYRIREVDGDDEADTLASLHNRTFGASASHGDYGDGYWWIAYLDDDPIAFAGCGQSILDNDMGYFSRVGVLRGHRGNKIQRRLMRCFEAKARRVGWKTIVTDTTITTDTIHSANNILAAGYQLYHPIHPWAFAHTLYWRKNL